MHKVLRLVSVGLIAAALASPVAAQEDEERVDSAFSDQIIRALGYSEIEINVGPDGVEAPGELEAGLHLITLSADDPYIGYLGIVQPPDGLSQEELTRLAEEAGTNDLPQHDWVYLGGTNTPGVGETASFVIDLAPGEYQISASYYTTVEGFDEIYTLVPLTVTDPAAGAAPLAEPEAAVTLEQTDDLQYLISPDPVPAGPRIWKITNSGEMMAHHVVMLRVPDGVTAPEIISEFNALMAGTPPAGDSVMMQGVWVGYAALQSGGTTTWAEFDLKPATYAAVCFILDAETGRPHAADGMVTVFTVA